MDYFHLVNLRQTDATWQLLRADHAPLVISFFYREFIALNIRTLSQSEMEAKLEDELFQLREVLGAEAFPKSARQYLNDWTSDEKGWLRKFYPNSSDEPHFDLTPAAEKAIRWLDSLSGSSFIGTESRLRTVFDLLQQIVAGTETSAETRIHELEKRRAEIDSQILRLQAGEVNVLDNTSLKDRFQQVSMLARSLLGDFREVEHNFRQLDRRIRVQIAEWEGRKGELLAKVFGARDAIADTDQGRSFRAFWEFIMSSRRREEFGNLLDQVFEMEAIKELKPDLRLKRIHYDWFDAGERTQRTVARLSQQLRRFLEDQVYLENRRIIQIFQKIESKAVKLRDKPPSDRNFFAIDEPGGVAIELPMERPLYSIPFKPRYEKLICSGDDSEVDAEALFSQLVVDREEIQDHIQTMLRTESQVSVAEIIRRFPLKYGLSELVAYLSIAGEDPRAFFDESVEEVVEWPDGEVKCRKAKIPRIIFTRNNL